MSHQIISFEKKQINRGFFKTEMVDVTVAQVKLSQGSTIFVSRFKDEEKWVADAVVSSTGKPIFMNGEGTRVTSARVLNLPEVIAELDKMNGN